MAHITFRDCKYRQYCNGHKIGRDFGYPESCWGTYLPGDEPGNKCTINDIECEPDGNVDISECFRMDKLDKRHPNLSEGEPIKDFPIWLDKETNDYYFPEGGYWMSSREFQMAQIEQIKTLISERIQEYRDDIINNKTTPQIAVDCLQNDLDIIQSAIGEAYTSIGQILSTKSK